jgi:hypothetical protein
VKIQTLTEAELAAEKAKFGVWPKGNYDFEIVGAEDAISKAGNEMIVLDIHAFDQHGNRKTLKDWLVDTVPIKMHNVCHATGLHALYARGNVNAFDFVGRTGRLTMGIQKQDGFEDRNRVLDYIPADTHANGNTARRAPATEARKPAAATVGGGDLDDDSIPF